MIQANTPTENRHEIKQTENRHTNRKHTNRNSVNVFSVSVSVFCLCVCVLFLWLFSVFVFVICLQSLQKCCSVFNVYVCQLNKGFLGYDIRPFFICKLVFRMQGFCVTLIMSFDISQAQANRLVEHSAILENVKQIQKIWSSFRKCGSVPEKMERFQKTWNSSRKYGTVSPSPWIFQIFPRKLPGLYYYIFSLKHKYTPMT